MLNLGGGRVPIAGDLDVEVVLTKLLIGGSRDDVGEVAGDISGGWATAIGGDGLEIGAIGTPGATGVTATGLELTG